LKYKSAIAFSNIIRISVFFSTLCHCIFFLNNNTYLAMIYFNKFKAHFIRSVKCIFINSMFSSNFESKTISLIAKCVGVYCKWPKLPFMPFTHLHKFNQQTHTHTQVMVSTLTRENTRFVVGIAVCIVSIVYNVYVYNMCIFILSFTDCWTLLLCFAAVMKCVYPNIGHTLGMIHIVYFILFNYWICSLI
jgi:hypothetical protein